MTTPEFEELLDRYQNGTCTPAERKRIEGWLDSHTGNSAFDDDSERKYVEKLLLNKIKHTTGRSKQSIISMHGMWRVAASLLLILAAGYAFWQYTATNASDTQNKQTKVSTANAIEKTMLSDGTIVWIKPGSKLIYPEKFEGATRVVSLQGEALFEVKKDPAHPFIIHCGDLTTSVLGTSFNIKSKGGHTEVFVLTGKVSVTSERSNKHVELLPNESATYAHATRQLQKIDKQSGQNTAAYTQGTTYKMTFENTTIREIASRIEDKFNVHMTVDGPVDGCLITADLTDQSLENTLDIISETINATYSIQNNTIVLRGNGCL